MKDRILINLYNKLDKPEEEDGYLKIRGYACRYNEPNFNGEIVCQHSFDRFINEYYSKSNLMPSMTYEHDSKQVVGKWNLLEPHNENGLYVEGMINLQTKFVQEYLAPLVLDGTISYLSTEGYVDRNSIRWNDNDTYTVNDFQLTAISLVSIPACNSAAIEVYNSIKENTSIKKPKYFLWL